MEIKGVTQTIIEFLRTKIITGELTSGQRLNEGKIAADLNISRSPLREAFRVLEREHLVVNVPRRGTYITKVTVKDLRALREIREMIEYKALDILKMKKIKELPTVEKAIILAINYPLADLSDEHNNKLSYLRVISSFHTELIIATGNYWLQDFYKTISTNIMRFQFVALYDPHTEKDFVLQKHKEILELIKMGKYNDAKKCMKNHIMYSFRTAEKGLKKISLPKVLETDG